MPIFLNIDLSSLIIQQEIRLKAPVSRVYDAMTGDLSAWWGYPFLVGQDTAEAITLEPELGGRFFETWAGGGGIVLATVSCISPGRRITLQGYMSLPGPLAGIIDYRFRSDAPTETVLEVRHSAFGTFDWQAHEHYTQGWNVLLHTRLKPHVEDGVVFKFR